VSGHDPLQLHTPKQKKCSGTINECSRNLEILVEPSINAAVLIDDELYADILKIASLLQFGREQQIRRGGYDLEGFHHQRRV